jgi:hypothetical protein
MGYKESEGRGETCHPEAGTPRVGGWAFYGQEAAIIFIDFTPR